MKGTILKSRVENILKAKQLQLQLPVYNEIDDFIKCFLAPSYIKPLEWFECRDHYEDFDTVHKNIIKTLLLVIKRKGKSFRLVPPIFFNIIKNLNYPNCQLSKLNIAMENLSRLKDEELATFVGKQYENILFSKANFNKVEIYTDSKFNPNVISEDNSTPMRYVLERRLDINVIKDLIYVGADVNAKDKDGRTPLHYAVGYNDRGARIADQQ